MKKNGSLIFFGVFILVSLVTAYQYFQSERTQSEQTKQSQLIKLEKDQINEVSFSSPNESFRLKRNQDGWALTEPFADLADSEHMENFISTALQEKSLSVAKEGSDIDWSLFGLKTPVASYQFIDQSGKAVQLFISGIKNFEGNPYLRRDNDNQVLVGGLVWTNFSSKKVMDFRNKKIFQASRADVQEVQFYHQGNKKIHLELIDGQWSFKDHKNWVLDQNEVRSLLTSLSEWKATEISPLSPLEKENLKKNRPQFSLKLKVKGQDWLLDINQSPTKLVFGALPDSDWSYQLEKDFFETLQGSTDRDYRDHKEPFSFDKKAVNKMVLVSPLKKVSLVKASANWEFEPKSDQPVVQEKADELLERIRSSQVAEFLENEVSRSKLKAFKPTHQVDLLNSQNELIFSISWSDKKDLSLISKNYYLTKTSRSGEIFYAESSSLDLLSSSQLVSDKK